MSNNSISSLIAGQFPATYRERAEEFVLFARAYYDWLESTELTDTEGLVERGDVDQTVDDFLVYFKEKYLQPVQFETESNKRLFIKNALEFYRAKGTERAVDLFFKLIYGEAAEIYYPSKDIFRLSDGRWRIPRYIEVTPSDYNLAMIGRQIDGVTSGASAYVDRFARKRIGSKYVHILFVSNVSGEFIVGERLIEQGTTVADTSQLPAIVGSMTALDIINGGFGFEVGDILQASANGALSGAVRVAETADVTGIVNFSLDWSGWGYTNTAPVLISDNVLSLANVVANTTAWANDEIDNAFGLFGQLVQPMANISFDVLSGTFIAGEPVTGYYANNDVAATGTVLEANNVASGSLLLTTLSGDYTGVQTIGSAANAATANVTAVVDATVTANVMGISNTLVITGTPVVLNFNIGEELFQPVGNTVAAVGTIEQVVTSGGQTTLTLSGGSGVWHIGVSAFSDAGELTVNQVDTSIGVIDASGTLRSDATNFVYSGDTTARIDTISFGSGANFAVGDLTDIETVSIYTDLLAGNNTSNAEFMTVGLNDAEYGFAKMPTANVNTVMFNALSLIIGNIGGVGSLTAINPGSGYNVPPFVLIYQPEIAGLQRRSYVFTIDSQVGAFLEGELLQQSVTIPNTAILTVEDVAGTFDLGEFIFQSNGTANVATGILFQANSSQMSVNSVFGVFDTAYDIEGLTSGATANVEGVVAGSLAVQARGLLQEANSTILTVQRQSLETAFVEGQTVTGVASGATANVVFIGPNLTQNQIGADALVSANVTTGNGTVVSVDVIDSGFGFTDDVNVQLTANGGLVISGRAQIGAQGQGQGRYTSSDSFISDRKKLHDGDYYQQFSYEVRSRVPLSKYADILKNVLHVAGTKTFGAIVMTSDNLLNLTANSTVEIA